MPGFPNEIKVDDDTRAGRMLAEGQVRVTVKSRLTGKHITVRFKCCRDNREGTGKNWPQAPMAEADRIFIDVPAVEGFGDKVGTFYPGNGRFYSDRAADPARIWAAAAAAEWLNGQEIPQAEIAEESRCGRCGLELTDPESIARGIGPECFAKATGSEHQRKAVAA